MAHTKDRTLLASLSFGDKDKKDRRHDLAGQYLIQPEVATKIVKLFTEEGFVYERGNLEIPLTKGSAQYKTFIGFIDGALYFRTAANNWEVQLFFEVKIHPETAGNVLRQLKLYEEFLDGGAVELLVTAYDVSPADQALFKANGITCVRLGEAFDEFVKAQEAASKTHNEKVVVI